ncbi:hypothetical protein Tsp_06203 [Trichinella spiralis]|nr:hypothetical protein Tsp_06203 [Trichinella spiralis]
MLATSSIPHHFNPSHGIMCTTIFPAMQYLQIVNTVHLRWCPCVFYKFGSVSCHQCGSKVIDKLGKGLPSVDAPSVRSRSVRFGKNSLDPDSDIQLKATWLFT